MQRAKYLLLGLALLLCSAAAQFGIPKKPSPGGDIPEQLQAEISSAGRVGKGDEGILSEQDAADMAHLIHKAQSDPDTMNMVAKMKAEMSSELEELSKQPAEAILGGMKQALEEIKMLDVLFKDPKRALKEMDKEGMIEKAHLKKYQKNPGLLEEDTRKGLYFQFVSLAAAGGFL